VDAPGRSSADHRVAGWTSESAELSQQGSHQHQWVRSAVALSHQVSKATNGGNSSTPGQPVSVLHHLPVRKLLLMPSWDLPGFLLWPLRSRLPLRRIVWLCHLCNCPSSSCGLLPDTSLATAMLDSTKPALSASTHVCCGHLDSFVLDPHQCLT